MFTMHEEIELVSRLSGLVFSMFLDRIVFINSQIPEEIRDPRISYFPQLTGWVVRLSWLGTSKILSHQREFNVSELKALNNILDTVAGSIVVQALSEYPSPKYTQTTSR